jgi:hypothetical protein
LSRPSLSRRGSKEEIVNMDGIVRGQERKEDEQSLAVLRLNLTGFRDRF